MKEWIVICNTKYYELKKAFENTTTITWPQVDGVSNGDFVYFYVTSPYRAILYKCEVISADLLKMDERSKNYVLDNSFYDDVHTYMNLKLLISYPEGILTDTVLKKNGIANLQSSSLVSAQVSSFLKRYDKKKKSNRMVIGVAAGVVVLAAAIGITWLNSEQKKSATYDEAVQLMEKREYENAVKLFEGLEKYKDSEEQVKTCEAEIEAAATYEIAVKLKEEGKYEEAIELFKKLDSHGDSIEQIKTCEAEIEAAATYEKAVKLMEEEKYESAITLFENLEGYKNSAEQIKICEKAIEKAKKEAKYLSACGLMLEEKYGEAAEVFKELDGYRDSSSLYEEAKKEEKYLTANELMLEKKYGEATVAFKELDGYKDSDSLYMESKYKNGIVLFNNNKCVKAVDIFKDLGMYKQSKFYLKLAKYKYVKSHMKNTDEITYSYLKDLKAANYSDSASIFQELYAWEISNIRFSSSEDAKVYRTTISKFDPVYCHYTVTGGEPGKSLNLYIQNTFPDGSSHEKQLLGKFFRGESLFFYWEEGIYTNPEYGQTGTLTMTFYDENDNIIGSGSVKMTD